MYIKRNACKAKIICKEIKTKKEQICSTLYTHKVAIFLSHIANLVGVWSFFLIFCIIVPNLLFLIENSRKFGL